MRVGPWRAPRRFLPVALVPVVVYLALWGLVGYSLGAAGCREARPMVPLLGAGAGHAAGAPGDAGAVEVLVESDRFALPVSGAPAAGTASGAPAAPASSISGGPIGNRFEAGWERRSIGGREALVPISGSGRLLAVNLGEEVVRTLTLDLVRAGLPEGERLSVRTGDRELARAVLRAAALPLRVRLPEDLPVGAVLLDLVFAPAAAGSGIASNGSGGSSGNGGRSGKGGAGGAAVPSGPPAPLGAGLVPALHGAGLTPALPAGSARVEGADLVMAGNCLAYLRCQLGGREALVGTFVPPAAPRPGQRFELSVELPDGTPIRRYGWRPSFWNRLRGARSFELPLRGTRGPVRVRLISRAGDAGDARTAADAGDAAGPGPAGRWRRLGLVDVTGQILTPGQGQ